MAFHNLDDNGKRIPRDRRSNRKPAKREESDVELFHYEIIIDRKLADGKRKQIRRRYWLRDDVDASDKERELKNKPPRKAMTWIEGHQRWLRSGKKGFVQGHIATSKAAIDSWVEAYGAQSTIEGTTLRDYVKWIDEKAKDGTGRAAQVRHAHMLAIARWCRSRGLVEKIPFEHAPKPEASMQERRAATMEEFSALDKLLPESMHWLWLLLGLTGMRISAACGIKEGDISEKVFRVHTKFGAEVDYPLLSEIEWIFQGARELKVRGRLKGRGKKKVTIPIDTPFIFCNDRGVPWTKDTFNHKLGKIQKNAKIDNPITPHQLRHMVGTVGAESGLSPIIIQSLLAHESIESSKEYIDQTMTMRKTGLHVMRDALRVAGFLQEIDMKNTAKKSHIGREESSYDASCCDVTCPACGHKWLLCKE